MNNIRNFVIIAHIDAGKSTLADRFLEITGTVEARNMRPQYLDRMELERERGITIKMAPVRMLYEYPARIIADKTQIVADKSFLYADLTYKIRGAAFEVWNKVGPGLKESIYQNALEVELRKNKVEFMAQPTIQVEYDTKVVGYYRPDLLVEDKILVELKSLPFIGDTEKKQIWSYLKGSSYRLALFINFGPKKVDVERIVYDSIRDQRSSASNPRSSAQVEQYVLNLIDTPGHSDFSYEVSRALAAVEGAILLVDGTKGIQAQTLSNLRAARKAGLKVIGAVNKIDLLQAQTYADGTQANADNRLNKVVRATAELLGVDEKEIFRVSAKTGQNVEELLKAVIEKVPPPQTNADYTQTDADKIPRKSALSPRESAMPARALIFDSLYDDHKGILAFARVFGGELIAGKEMALLATGTKARVKEVGFFSPEFRAAEKISAGEIGYIATGLKEPALIKIGDTIITRTNADRTQTDADKIPRKSALSPRESASLALPGYKEPVPVVFISFYPDGATKFEDLKKGLERLRLTDAALSFEPDANEALGRGLKVGFLGQLHFEIAASRLKREFNLEFLTSFPSIAYRIKDGTREFIAKQPQDFPEKPERAWQPMIKIEILTPQAYLNQVVNLKTVFDMEISEIKNLGDNLLIIARMPLAELIRDFDDRLKSVSAGFASFSYELDGEAPAEVEKLETLIVGDVVPALTRIVPKKDLEKEARSTVLRLKKLLPKQQFSQAIQAKAEGRIIARETIPAMRKDVTGYLYGGDRSRKMKLWKKQQRGKEKLKEMAKAHISPEVFREILKK